VAALASLTRVNLSRCSKATDPEGRGAGCADVSHPLNLAPCVDVGAQGHRALLRRGGAAQRGRGAAAARRHARHVPGQRPQHRGRTQRRRLRTPTRLTVRAPMSTYVHLCVTFLGSDRNTVGALNGGDYARQRASRCGRLCPPMSTYVSRSWAATATPWAHSTAATTHANAPHGAGACVHLCPPMCHVPGQRPPMVSQGPAARGNFVESLPSHRWS
jgi:hypothetical protein